jgi:hypothetical protein
LPLACQTFATASVFFVGASYGIATSVALFSVDRDISKIDLTLRTKFLRVLPIQGSVIAHRLLHMFVTSHYRAQQLVQIVERNRNTPYREVIYAAFRVVLCGEILVFSKPEASLFRFDLSVPWLWRVRAHSARANYLDD